MTLTPVRVGLPFPSIGLWCLICWDCAALPDTIHSICREPSIEGQFELCVLPLALNGASVHSSQIRLGCNLSTFFDLLGEVSSEADWFLLQEHSPFLAALRWSILILSSGSKAKTENGPLLDPWPLWPTRCSNDKTWQWLSAATWLVDCFNRSEGSFGYSGSLLFSLQMNLVLDSGVFILRPGSEPGGSFSMLPNSCGSLCLNAAN